MLTKVIEATNGFNHGKFMVARFSEDEWTIPGALHTVSDTGERAPETSVIAARGWDRTHIWVLDLQTGEGALFRPGGLASADLAKHAIWVCPLYEPFLTWLYGQDLSSLEALPAAVRVEGGPAFYGHRRPGPDDDQRTRVEDEDLIADVAQEMAVRAQWHRARLNSDQEGYRADARAVLSVPSLAQRLKEWRSSRR